MQNLLFLDPREKRFFEAVAEWHADHKRKYTGLPYTTHLLNVAQSVQDLKHNTILTAAALGHDLFEDTSCTEKELQATLLDAGYNRSESREIIDLIYELTDEFTAEKHPDKNRKLRKKLEAKRLASCSKNAQTIKYADLIDNALDIAKNDAGFFVNYHREMGDTLQRMNRGNMKLYSRAMRVWHELLEQQNDDSAQTLVKAYLKALGKGDVRELLKLFTDDARVFSPRYGEQAASTFFPDLFKDTAKSELHLYDVFQSPGGDICAYFHYDWTLNSGELISFDVCDVMTMSEDRKIRELRIIYST
ncbi:MAG: HD domain-containing protein [Bacteroidetes bacterium]|nr:HD domain-containing protein [Bacteroidota bacterium]